MGSDSFVNHTDNPFDEAPGMDDNFFLQPENIMLRQKEPLRRLNDYDCNILKEEAYKEVADEIFKLEYKISKIEEEIKMLDVQIQASKDIHDFTTVEILNNRKKLLKEEHENLTALYNDASISTKISGGLTDGLRANLLVFKQLIASYTENLISKLPAPFSSVIELKKSLSKLEIINKNVDELMKLNTPYGEAYDKYEQLSKYIVRANSIQSEIAKSLK